MTENYHLNAIKNALKNVELSGEPAEIGDVYINYLANGCTQFESLVHYYGLTYKLNKTTGRYIIEKPGKAYK